PRPQADDHRPFDVGMEKRAQEANHDLRGSVDARVAVALSVDDEGPAHATVETDGALFAVAFPLDGAADHVGPLSIVVERRRGHRWRAPDADLPVPPDGRRTFRFEQE